VSSSACSPASSPTEQLGLFDVIEDGVNNVNEKLKHLKNQENGSDTGVANWTSQSHNTTETDGGQFKTKEGSKQQEAILANHVESSLSDMKDEVAVKELQERSQHGAEESGNFSQEVEKQRIYANGGSLYEGNGDFEAIRSACSSQRSLQGISQHDCLSHFASSSLSLIVSLEFLRLFFAGQPKNQWVINKNVRLC
jgi:hypothetical protein